MIFLTFIASMQGIGRILCEDHVRFVDAGVIMNSPRKSACDALAALFDALEPLKAHGYCIIPRSPEDHSSDKMKAFSTVSIFVEYSE